MAITVVGRNISTAYNTAITNTHGLSIQSGDLIIAAITNNANFTVSDNNGANNFSEDWTSLYNGTGGRFTVLSREAGGSEPSTYNFTLSGLQAWICHIFVFRGADTNYDVAPASVNLDEGTGTPLTATSITTLTNDAIAILLSADDAGSGVHSNATNGFDTNFDYEGSGTGLGSSSWKLINTAGAVGDTSTTTSVSTNWGSMLFAVKPLLDIKTVSILLGDRTGTKRADLTGLKWAWFDETAPNNFTAPTDTGTAETTDTNGLLEITLGNTSLVAGQYGCLAISTSDDVDLGLYKLRVY